ncbi:Chaperone protein dnaJ 11, chloroplastic [Apostasia shenzhenica]|uniref:Chaperone protein dnaJ 11, chloroplastic n=1 Tax=Apostasia shenzhenica TaxID=1088818 RepID=A0A2H9ZRG2_9ASPA|nr:Chaperone protein dnaJ 11, chloroplastic [Apostasia shenzhenica]
MIDVMHAPLTRPQFLGRRIAAPRLCSPATYLPFRSSRTAAASSSAADRASTARPPLPPASSSLYNVLGVDEEATAREIKTAYRRLARDLHPDAAAAAGRSGESADEFMRIHAAYSTLSDPAKRAAYDREILVRRLSHRTAPLVYGFSGYGRPRRIWETDQCW